MDGTRTQINENGNTVVAQVDGSTITFMQTGEKIYKYPDGALQQINPDGSAVIVGADGSRSTIPSPQKVEAASKTPEPAEPTTTLEQGERSTTPRARQDIGTNISVRQVDPKELFAEHIERAKSAGNAIVSEVDKRGSRKVVFEDGGKLVLTKEGIMIHKYADGKKDQCTPDGNRVTVRYIHTILRYAIDLLLWLFHVPPSRVCLHDCMPLAPSPRW